MNMAIENERPPLQVEADGTVRVAGTRVTLDTVIIEFRAGAAPEQITKQYPTVSLADAYAVIAYYLKHSREVDAYLKERQQEALALRESLAIQQSLRQIRERLLSRQRS